MKIVVWRLLTLFCIFWTEALSKPQQIITAVNINDTKPNIPLDPFLEDEELEEDYSSVVCMKFHLNDETLPDLFSRLALLEMECPIPECSVTVADLIEATQIARYKTEDIAKALEKLNVEIDDVYNIFLIYNVNSTTLENLLQQLGITFSEIYNNFVKSLSNPGRTIPQVLDILNVSLVEFMTVQAYGNDSERLRVLFTGNYSQSNINKVLNVTEKTGMDMLQMIPLNVSAKNIKNINSQEFLAFVKNLGVTSNDLKNFYEYLNITHINFLAYSPFISIMVGLYDHLNSEEVLGTVISRNKVITSNKSKTLLQLFTNRNTELVRNYAEFYVELVENPLLQHPVKNISFFNPEYQSRDIALVEIANSFITSVSETAKVYNTSVLLNCTYISRLPFGGIYFENIPKAYFDKNIINITKSNNTIYNLGSPLFCQEKLYGIAIQNNSTGITFSTLAMTMSGTTPKPVLPTKPNTSDNKGNSGVTPYFNIFNVIILVIVITN